MTTRGQEDQATRDLGWTRSTIRTLRGSLTSSALGVLSNDY